MPLQGLRIIGAVEILPSGALAGAGMVTTDDEMGDAMVCSDQTVPDCLSRTGHAHRNVQKAHRGGRLRVFVQHRLIASHAGKVVDVTGFGHAHNWVNQQVCLRLLGRPEGQFLMRAVQGIAGLEGHDLFPAEFLEIGAQFVWRVASRPEVVVDGRLNALNLPPR